MPQLVEPLEAFVARVAEVPRLGHREVQVAQRRELEDHPVAWRPVRGVHALGGIVRVRQWLPGAAKVSVEEVLVREGEARQVGRCERRLHVVRVRVKGEW